MNLTEYLQALDNHCEAVLAHDRAYQVFRRKSKSNVSVKEIDLAVKMMKDAYKKVLKTRHRLLIELQSTEGGEKHQKQLLAYGLQEEYNELQQKKGIKS